MADFPGDENQINSDGEAVPPRRRLLPWVAVAVVCVLAFALGLFAGPWLSNEMHSRFLFGKNAQPVEIVATRQEHAQAARVERRLETLEQQTAAGDQEQQRQAVTDLGGRMDALEKRFDELDSRSSMALANASRAEGMLLTLAARRAVDTGQQLGVIEGMLRERFGGTQPQAVASLIAAAQKPVTLSQLQAGLETLQPQIRQAVRGGGWWEELRSDLASLIIVRRKGSETVEPLSQLDQARSRLATGDVAGALWLIGRLPGDVRTKAAGWITAARRYVVARQALDMLETVALLAPPPGHDENVVPLPSPPPAPEPAGAAVNTAGPPAGH